MDAVILGVVCFTILLLMATGHYFPWPIWLRGTTINRLFSYAWGTGWVMFGAFLVTALTHRNYVVLGEIFTLFTVAGLTTAGCYGWDHIRDTSNRGRRRAKANGQ